MADAPAGGIDQAARMDRMYRYTRHIYDLSRKFYLFGRDRLIARMKVEPGDRVLEIGCGTARNLIKLHRKAPQVELYGLDVAKVMLETAEKNLASHGLAGKATLACIGAEKLDHRETFNLDQPFDAVFFSYSLSMIPPWKEAIDAALANVKPGGCIYIVDFWDQGNWPGPMASALRWWLSLFHVHHRPELMDRLRELEAQGAIDLHIEGVFGRYAWIAQATRRNA